MKLPTLQKQQSTFPDKAICPWCRVNKVFEPHSMAILEGGARFIARRCKGGGTADAMDGFLSLTWHGAHDDGVGQDRDILTKVHIAEDVRGGQFEIYFCSTHCLRSYLNFCVDELENEIRKSSKAVK